MANASLDKNDPMEAPLENPNQLSTTVSHIRQSPINLLFSLLKDHPLRQSPPSPPRREGPCLFFDQPAEIRQQIYYALLLIQSNMFLRRTSGCRNTLDLDPIHCKTKGERGDRRNRIVMLYWGTEVFSNIFPVCRQWCNEIQEVFYSRFNFRIEDDLLFKKLEGWSTCLDFLPLPAFDFIRYLSVQLRQPWNNPNSDCQARTKQEFENLAKKLRHLKAIAFHIEHVYDEENDPKGDWGILVSHSAVPRTIDTILSFIQPFKHLLEINLVVPDLYFEEPRSESDTGIPLELIIPVIKSILLTENSYPAIAAPREVNFLGHPDNTTNASLWKEEVHESSWNTHYMMYEDDLRRYREKEDEGELIIAAKNSDPDVVATSYDRLSPFELVLPLLGPPHPLHQSRSCPMKRTRPCLFFEQPLEIRRHTFYMLLLIQSNMFITRTSGCRNTVRMSPGYRRSRPTSRHVIISMIYWGTEASSNVFPVCKQWYAEIQEVFYSKFILKMCGDVSEKCENRLTCLDFLPAPAFQHLRCLSVPVFRRWNDFSSDAEQKLRQGLEALATNLCGLKAITFELIHDSDEDNDPKGDQWDILVSTSAAPKVTQALLSCIRPFLHLSEINLKLCDERLCEPRPYAEPGIPLDEIIFEVKFTLTNEIELFDRTARPKVNYLACDTATIWREEVYQSSWNPWAMMYGEDYERYCEAHPVVSDDSALCAQ